MGDLRAPGRQEIPDPYDQSAVSAGRSPRESHAIPYKNGYYGEAEPPFVNFQMELTDTAYIEAGEPARFSIPFKPAWKGCGTKSMTP